MDIGLLIIREIKLYQLGIIELDGTPKKVYESLNEHLTVLNEYKHEWYHNYRFFGNSNTDILINFDSNDTKALYIRDDILIKLRDEVNLYKFVIEEVVKWWCSEKLKIKFKYATNTSVYHKCI